MPHVKDHLGRFSAHESLGFKYNFLDSPVIDIWSYKLKVLLQQTFPQLLFPEKQTTVHSLINAQVAYAFLNKGMKSSSQKLIARKKLLFAERVNKLN